MLADSATDRRVLVQVTGDDTEPGRRVTLIRATSELGVHRRGDVVTERSESADGEVDRHTPLQVTVNILYRVVDFSFLFLFIFVNLIR